MSCITPVAYNRLQESAIKWQSSLEREKKALDHPTGHLHRHRHMYVDPPKISPMYIGQSLPGGPRFRIIYMYLDGGNMGFRPPVHQFENRLLSPRAFPPGGFLDQEKYGLPGVRLAETLDEGDDETIARCVWVDGGRS